MKQLALLTVLALATAIPAAAQVTLTQTPEHIAVEIDGKPFTLIHVAGKNLNRPYLYPLRTAAGKIVNRSFPAGQLPGETTDHPHHAGLFYGHGDVNGFNYWAIENVPTPASKADATMGRIVLARVVSVTSGQESGSVDIIFNWLKPDGAPLLTETRKMTFHAHPELRIIDFDFDFAAVEMVVFRDTKEGTFAMRMATAIEERSPKPGTLRNAQGGVGEANVWGKRSEWVDYSGDIDGAKAGVVMMDHPGNPRHPTYWHSRGYGLHAINPFGVSDFLNDKTQNGSLSLAPGEHVRFRYRVIVHQGLTPARLQQLYDEYARTGSNTPHPK
ncbi:MAG TPA: PmoA family protein [Vicinamibacterales bacterium]|nr:PmoA family protein [Vicinamibacterales bacterium]